MTVGALNFWQAAPGSLNFGATSEGGSTVSITVVTSWPTPDVALYLGPPPRFLSVSVTTALPEPSFAASYDLRVPLGPWIHSQQLWDEGTPTATATHLDWQAAPTYWHSPRVPWGPGQAVTGSIRSGWLRVSAIMKETHLPWGEGQRLPVGVDSVSDWPELSPLTLRVPWGEGQRLTVGVDSISAFPDIVPKEYGMGWEESERVTQGFGVDWGEGFLITQAWRLPWSLGHVPWPGWWFTEPESPPGIPHNWRLNFSCPAPGTLNFGDRCFGLASQWPSVRRSYRVLNSGSLKRLSDNADIPVTQMTIQLDRDSWGWTLSATLANQAGFDRLTGTWPEVEATINGFTWRFVMDPPQRSRKFGSRSYTIEGRSLAAHLTEPIHAAKNYREAALKSAEQLCLQELPPSGLWSLDWDAGLPTWSIAGGIFQYDNQTPLQVIQRVAASCGGIVQADANALKLWLKPKWPIKPWAWNEALADLTLPASYVVSESATPQVGYNANSTMVFSEGASGIVAQVKIAGTAGDLQTRQGVVNALIVDAYPAAALGIQTLADTWTVTQHQVELPLQAIPNGAGLITPGLVIDFDESGDGWRGLVISTRISASFGKVMQTLEVIRA
jgi:hypothetical protein